MVGIISAWHIEDLDLDSQCEGEHLKKKMQVKMDDYTSLTLIQ